MSPADLRGLSRQSPLVQVRACVRAAGTRADVRLRLVRARAWLRAMARAGHEEYDVEAELAHAWADGAYVALSMWP